MATDENEALPPEAAPPKSKAKEPEPAPRSPLATKVLAIADNAIDQLGAVGIHSFQDILKMASLKLDEFLAPIDEGEGKKSPSSASLEDENKALRTELTAMKRKQVAAAKTGSAKTKKPQ